MNELGVCETALCLLLPTLSSTPTYPHATPPNQCLHGGCFAMIQQPGASLDERNTARQSGKVWEHSLIRNMGVVGKATGQERRGKRGGDTASSGKETRLVLTMPCRSHYKFLLGLALWLQGYLPSTPRWILYDCNCEVHADIVAPDFQKPFSASPESTCDSLCVRCRAVMA